MSTTAAATARSPSPVICARPRRPGGLFVRNFGRIACRPRSCPARRRAFHRRRRPDSPLVLDRNPLWSDHGLRRVAVKSFYTLLNWGARTQRFRPTPAAFGRLVVARGGCVAATAGAQPLLQGLGRAGSAFARCGLITSRKRASTAAPPGTRCRLTARTAFSVAPLRFATMLGVVLAVIAFIYGLHGLGDLRRVMAETCRVTPSMASVVSADITRGGRRIYRQVLGRVWPVYFVAEHDMKSANRRPHRGRMSEMGLRRIWLAPTITAFAAVSAAIRDLLARQRINASAMLVRGAESWQREGVRWLRPPRRAPRMHLTLTAPFRRLSAGFTRRAGARSCCCRPWRAARWRAEAEAAGGRNFQSVRGLPGRVRPPAGFRRWPPAYSPVFLNSRRGPARCQASRAEAWLRGCGRPALAQKPRRHPQGPLVLDARPPARACAALPYDTGTRTNPAFAGTYGFAARADYENYFRASSMVCRTAAS